LIVWPDDDLIPAVPEGRRYVCAQCGRPGSPDPGMTRMDDRYATGTCTGTHVGKQQLIREDLYGSTTEKPKRGRKQPSAGDRQG
jgi:hypothetical protein